MVKPNNVISESSGITSIVNNESLNTYTAEIRVKIITVVVWAVTVIIGGVIVGRILF
jgi:hypothetical protein